MLTCPNMAGLIAWSMPNHKNADCSPLDILDLKVTALNYGRFNTTRLA